MTDSSSGDTAVEPRNVDLVLTSVRPQRFKASFKPPAVGLGQFNVIIGRNGSGKSTLLEALQWLDTAIRRDAREACDRYYGISDLINLRSRSTPNYFQIDLEWSESDVDLQELPDGSFAPKAGATYSIKVKDADGVPAVLSESLDVRSDNEERQIIRTAGGVRFIGSGDSSIRVVDPERLALAFIGDTQLDDPVVRAISNFWSRAVFLRLSPNRLAQGSQATRKSFAPMLDEEGQQLPALLFELSPSEREELALDISEMIRGIRSVEVLESGTRNDTRVNYNLTEEMPYRGRTGRYKVPIPAWMLSEGTRRVTALLALIRRSPTPSILCVEEVENGLDPWTTQRIVEHLDGGAAAGMQVLLTTHSPWLLDHVRRDDIVMVRRLSGDTQYDRFNELADVNTFDPSLPAGVVYANLES
ncbi:recombinase RecF [Rathayibacter sp. AY1E3]|uniref:AAA family ATPase n=1 Tax=Rathayibacter sp. AY1E3 TaxID=2080551 RepID=UPI000CE8DBD5|nr:ATP-binding protein [Rathayibacter sp. AY1E3]PPH39066.1 recombinase RecF [Rathayibacter sp. AY1E3]